MTPRKILLSSLLAFVAAAGCKGGSTSAPGRLLFGTIPPPVKVGQSFGPVIVTVSDSAGHPNTSATSAVTLYLENNPPGATLGGTLTVNAVAGIATFNNLTIDVASNQFQFAAFATGLTPGVSAPFGIDPPTGALVAAPGSPFLADGGDPVGMAIDRTGKFLYVGNRASGALSGYAISTSGSLAPVPGSPYANTFPTSTASGLTVDSSGRYVISPDPSLGNIGSYSLNAGGSLALVSGISSPYSVSIVADPVAPVIFVANQFNSTISTFTIAADGTPTQLGTAVSAPGQPVSLGIDPAGKFLFVLTLGNLQVFAIGPFGALTATGPLWDAGSGGGGGVAVDRTGQFLYIASVNDKAVYGFVINADGSLTGMNGSPFLTGAFARLGLAANPNLNVLYMVSNNARVSQLVLTSSGVIAGALASFAPTNGPNTAIAIDRQGKHLFVTTTGPSVGEIYAYTIAP